MSKRKLYQVIEMDILDKIQNGTYAEGTLIPKEIELVEIYNVSRPTVRQAIFNLVQRGYLKRVKRLGTIVQAPMIDQEFTHVIESFTSEMQRKGLKPRTIVLSFKKVTADDEISTHLGIKRNALVYKLVRLRYTDDKPIVLVTTYIPVKRFPDLDLYDFSDKSLYAIFHECNIPIKRIKRYLNVILADETTADLLDTNEGAPLFYFRSIGSTENEEIIEYSISKYRGDASTFVFDVINN